MNFSVGWIILGWLIMPYCWPQTLTYISSAVPRKFTCILGKIMTSCHIIWMICYDTRLLYYVVMICYDTRVKVKGHIPRPCLYFNVMDPVHSVGRRHQIWHRSFYIFKVDPMVETMPRLELEGYKWRRNPISSSTAFISLDETHATMVIKSWHHMLILFMTWQTNVETLHWAFSPWHKYICEVFVTFSS